MTRLIHGRRIRNERENPQVRPKDGADVPPWVTIEQIQKLLPQDTLLIDFVRFDPEGAGKKFRYAAWAIPSLRNRAGQEDALPITFADLGEADKVKVLTEGLHKAISSQATLEEDLLPKLAGVKRALLKPFDRHLGGRTRWIFSPTADVWLVPFQALPIPDDVTPLVSASPKKPYPGKWYVLEEHTISYFLSGRDAVSLLNPAQTPAVRPGMLLVGNPSFYDKADRKLKPAPAREAALQSTRLAHLRVSELKTGDKGFPFVTLPAFLIISKAIQDAAPTATALLEDKATEEAVSQSLKGGAPGVMVFCTHGFYLSPPTKAQEKPPLLLDHLGPLNRCGLALAGVNTRLADYNAYIKEDDKNAILKDGILLGSEIVRENFTGTELVVLIACESGDGSIVFAGESLASIRHAFQMAGARVVVATSWQLPVTKRKDDPALAVVRAFFDEIGKTRSPIPYHEVLRRAQLAGMYRNGKNGAAGRFPPQSWAAFSVTGQQN